MVVPLGITIVALVILAMMFGIAAVDAVLEAGRWEPIDKRLQTWSGRYPYFPVALAAMLGALLGHFFW
jgi:VanZ family protein